MNRRDFIVSCRDPTPPKDPNEDGNYIIENFTDQHEPSELRGPAILNFLEKPTLANAKAMLKIYNISMPLSSLLTRTQTQNPNPTPLNDSPKKGGKPTSIQYELLILDTMHDVLETEPIAMYDIFKKEIDIPKPLKDSFLKSNYNFTSSVAQYIQQKANIIMQNVSFDNKTKKAYDHNLASRISTWTNLTFVLDNFVANFQNGGGGPQSQGVLMLIGCAYLIVLLANMKRLNMLSNHQTITFLDGFFMKLDGSYISRFLSLFLKTLVKLTNLNTNIQPYKVYTKISTPKYFNKLFPEAHASISQTHVTLNNVQYDIFPVNPLPNQIYYPHSKQDLKKHIKSNPTNKDLWYLNFLRDAFKADVAFETDSVFVTHDQLAFTYYKLIGGKHGFLLSLSVKQHQNLNHAFLCDYNVAF
jgi:hypothetical protein